MRIVAFSSRYVPLLSAIIFFVVVLKRGLVFSAAEKCQLAPLEMADCLNSREWVNFSFSSHKSYLTSSTDRYIRS